LDRSGRVGGGGGVRGSEISDDEAGSIGGGEEAGCPVGGAG